MEIKLTLTLLTVLYISLFFYTLNSANICNLALMQITQSLINLLMGNGLLFPAVKYLFKDCSDWRAIYEHHKTTELLNICGIKGLQEDQIAVELWYPYYQSYGLLWFVLQSLAWFFLVSLTLICLSLLPSLTARLISVNYQWPTRFFYFGCETGRRAVDEIRFFTTTW